LWWGASDDEGIDADGGQGDWKWGGNSTSDLANSISTFQILDEIYTTLADKTLYPNLKRVVFSGNSAGGQLMQRLVMVTFLRGKIFSSSGVAVYVRKSFDEASRA
jgi:hypothetical protein